MIPLTKEEDQGEASDASAELLRAVEATLARTRSLLARGHVFAMDDDDTGRTRAGKRHRPGALVIVPPLDSRTAVALRQKVAVSFRLSWKDKWGVPGSSEAEAMIRRMKWVFSPKGSLPAFNKNGVFELDNRLTVTIAKLLNFTPLGWLPPPAITAIMTHAGARLSDPYPPTEGRDG
jgi:hypothetical protein